MKFLQRSTFSSRKNSSSVFKTKGIKLQTSAPIQLKYMHNRILDHIKMKKFLEPQEVNQFLNEINELITSQHDVEVLRKRIKNMLLTINDSLMEFKQAISSGEITFNSLDNENNEYAIEKPSGSTSGVFTWDENTCLSSLDLTNSNFLTIPKKDPEIEATQSQLLHNGNSVDMLTQDLSPSNSSTNESFIIPFNRTFTLKNNDQTEKNKFFEVGPKNSIYVIKPLNNRTSAQTSTKNIWKNSFHEIPKLEKQAENCNTQSDILTSDDNKLNKMIELCGFSQDLFIEPLPIGRRKETSKHISQLKTTKKYICMQDTHSRLHDETVQNISIDSSFGNSFVNNLKKLSLEEKTFYNNKNSTLHIPQKTEIEVCKLQKKDSKQNIKCVNPSNKIHYDDKNDSSESEIFFLAGPNADCVSSGENRKKLDPVKEQSFKFEIKKTQSDETPQMDKKIECLALHHCSSFQTQKPEEINVSILDTGCYIPDTFSKITQHPTNHSVPSQGVKRRFLEQSTNLSMINGEIISRTIDECNYGQNCFINSEIFSSETPIRKIKDSHDIDKELKEATLESSIIWTNLSNMLIKEKHNQMKSKECLIEYNNYRLKFPTGYKHYYKHLEDLLHEYKIIGISHNNYQTENRHCFFQDTMNNWTELQQIVRNIQKQERVKEKGLIEKQ